MLPWILSMDGRHFISLLTQVRARFFRRNFIKWAIRFVFQALEKVIGILIKNGANVSAIDNSGRTALHTAAHAGKLKLASSLNAKCVAFSKLYSRYDKDMKRLPRFSLKMGRVLMSKIRTDGHLYFMLLLLVKMNIELTFHKMPFLKTVIFRWFSGDEQTIELLVKNGSDINLKDNNGTTNLHSAVFLGNFFFQLVGCK